LSTVLGLIGFAGTVVLTWLLCWVYRECASEMRAATKTMRDQKSTIEVMSESQNITRYQIENLESIVAEREETIIMQIAQIEGMRSAQTDSAVRIEFLMESLKKERSKLIKAKQLAREIFLVNNLFQSTALDSSFDPKPPENQSQKTLCDN